MKASRAAWIVVLLPLMTAPWVFSGGSIEAWLGLPIWAAYSLSATIVVALLIATVTSRWWEQLADEADSVHAGSTTADENS